MIRLCECGCGDKTLMASKTDNKRGWAKGQPLRFIRGHNSKLKKANANNYKVDKNGCWVWQGGFYSTGYGRLIVKNKHILAHRFQFEKVNGLIPECLELDHLCRNIKCVNPKHLEAVTHAENCRRGSRAKLSKEKVNEIRTMKERGVSTATIAETFGVDWHTISAVINGKAWA